jgi:hypothetical protein
VMRARRWLDVAATERYGVFMVADWSSLEDMML